MSNFMQNHRVFLTPLSPIHIGCGEDFEPTNYIIDGQVLYHFDPSQLCLLPEQKEQLLFLAKNMNLLKIQQFFAKNKAQAIYCADYFANISTGLLNEWQEKIGKLTQKDDKVHNNFFIERTSFLPYRNAPYIPASSFKGALATTILNAKHQAKNSPKVEKRDHKNLLKAYIGDFQTSLLKQVKFGDFIPHLSETHSAQTQIYYAVNFKKKTNEKGNAGKGLTTRRECIMAGQYRQFISDVSFVDYASKDRNVPMAPTIQQCFAYLNQYHQPIFGKECDLLVSLGLLNRKWVSNIRALLADSSVALVRLGKNGSASKVYQGVAQISVNKKIQNEASTLWLAGESDKQQSELLPFGWALIELDNGVENPTLKQWCENQIKAVYFDKIQYLRDRETRINEFKLAQQQSEQAIMKKQLDTQAKQEAEQARKASLTEKQAMIETIVEKLQSAEVKPHTVSDVYQEAKNLINQAINENWSAEDKHHLAAIFALDAPLISQKVLINSDKAKKEYKKLLNRLVNQ